MGRQFVHTKRLFFTLRVSPPAHPETAARRVAFEEGGLAASNTKVNHILVERPVQVQGWGPLGGLLGASRVLLGGLLNRLGGPLGYLGPSWVHLGPSWRHLGAILGSLGTILAVLEAILDILEAS